MFFQSEANAYLKKLEKISGLSQLFNFHKVKPAQLLSSVSAVVIATSMLGFSPSPVLAVGDCDQQTTTGALVWSVTQLGSECVVQFTSGTGTWTPPDGVSTVSRYLVIGGGGSGGEARADGANDHFSGGAGGAGGVIQSSAGLSSVGQISITVGTGAAANGGQYATGNQGNSSTFGSISAGGGGAGHGANNEGANSGLQLGVATNGSGGGGGGYQVTGGGNGSGAGKNGGVGGARNGGGGGGAGGNGGNVTAGIGITSDITGTNLTYATGGSGGKKGLNAPIANATSGGGGSGASRFADGYKALAGNDGVVIVRYALPFFDVNFSSNFVNGPDIATERIGSQQILQLDSVQSPTRPDFEFQGWFVSSSGGNKLPNSYTVTANVTLYAQWLPLYTITFDAQGGSTPDAQIVTKALGAPSTTRAGFELQGWFTSETGGTPVSFPYSLPSDITLYAQWLPLYTITYEVQGGADLAPATVTGVATEPVTTKDTFQLAGFFDSPSGGNQITFPYTPTSDVTLFAQWIPLYFVSFEADNGTSISDVEVDVLASVTVPTKANFEFQGWFEAPSGGSLIAFPYSPESNVTLYAQWLPLYTITFNAQGGSPLDPQIVTKISEPVTTRPDFEFQGWFDSETGGNQIAFEYVPTSDITLYAQWLPIYTVTFNSRRGSVVSPIASAGSIASPATTRYGYEFQGWFDAVSGGSEIIFPYSPPSNLTIYAQWTHGAIAGMNQSILPTPTQIAIDGVNKKTFEDVLRPGASSKVEIPAGALPANTTVKIYTITNKDFVKAAISDSYSFLVTQIVSWTDANGDVAIATEPIVMTITDPSIVAGSRIYRIMSQVVTQIGVASQDGIAVITFTEDPLITIAITAPDSPQSLTATAVTQTSVNLTWAAPTVTGGDEISSYTVTASNGQSCTSEALSCTISGLSPSSSYTFTATATNSKGSSPASAPTIQVITSSISGSGENQSPANYLGPLLDSYAITNASLRKIVLTGIRLETVRKVWIAGDEITIVAQGSSHLEIELPLGLESGTFDVVLESAFGKVTIIDGLVVQSPATGGDAPSEPISKVSEDQKVNAGSFNGYVATYAKGHKGQTLSWRIGSKWFKVLLTSDFQVFQRKANGIGLDVQVEIYIDGEKQLTKTLTTR